MISFETYKKLFIFAIILYALLYPVAEVGNGIVMILFWGSTFAFVFSNASKPEKIEDIKVPEVHLYNSERLNILSYLIAGNAVVAGLVFYLMSIYTNIPEGIIALILWLDMVGFIGVLKKKYTPQNLGKIALIDYIYTKFNRSLDRRLIIKVVDKTLTIEDDEELINYLNTEKIIPESNREDFKRYFWEYLNLLQNQPNDITSEEVEEIKNN